MASDTKFFSFPDGNNGNNDLATLLALNGNNNGMFGNGGLGGGILGFFLGLLCSNGGFGNGLFGGGNSSVSDLLMQAITSQGEQSRTAINALSNALGQDFSLVNSSIQTISTAINQIGNQQGLNSMQVINAIQSGNAALANQLSNACCNMQNAITNQTYALTETANRNNQTILDKLSSMETRALQDKLEAARDKNTQLAGEISQLNQNQYIAGVVGQAIAPINAQLAALNKEVDDIKCNMPNTVPVQYPNIVGINTTPYMGYYGNIGGNGFWG